MTVAPAPAREAFIVLVSGDEDTARRSPAATRQDSRHALTSAARCFAGDPTDGTINRMSATSPASKPRRPTMVIFTRSDLPDDQMKHIVAYLEPADRRHPHRDYAFNIKPGKTYKYSQRERRAFARFDAKSWARGSAITASAAKYPRHHREGTESHPILRYQDGDIWGPPCMASACPCPPTAACPRPF